MEHTGIYNAHLLDFLHKLHFPIWLESSLQIKKAGGLQRGKTDSIDAQRIAEYAYRFRDQLRLWQPPRQVVQQLAMLSAARQRLIAVYNQLAGPLAEQQSFVNPTLQKQLLKSCQASLWAIDKDRKAIEKAIDALIEGDDQLKQLFALMTAVPGIGTVTATEVVIATNKLKSITDPKKMACHAGVAPFEYSLARVFADGLESASTLANGLNRCFIWRLCVPFEPKVSYRTIINVKSKKEKTKCWYSTPYVINSSIDYMRWSSGAENMTKLIRPRLLEP